MTISLSTKPWAQSNSEATTYMPRTTASSRDRAVKSIPSPSQPSKITSMAWPRMAGAHTVRMVETAPKRNVSTTPSLWSRRVPKRRPRDGQKDFALRGAELAPHSSAPTLSWSSAISCSDTTPAPAPSAVAPPAAVDR